ncbi:hypothetical protein ACFRR6_02120 [Streptomyces sp. NPDC056891]|uniref:hypothetical protein n=1 Tax=Streptomyces sp. NPDC056891 TaxID=3345961 RepID=UPI0036928707
MVLFHTFNELFGTVYMHRPTTATTDVDHRVREAWYGELMQQRRDEQRMNAGMPFVESITDLTVWPGRLEGLIPVEDVQPDHPSAGYAHSRTLDVFWPRLPGEQWLLLADATRPHAHHLAASTSHDAMLHTIALARGLGVSLLPTLSEISTSDCPCHSRKSVCEHIAALIECYARTLDHEPLTLLLLGGYAPTDFFALVDDPEHPSTQPYYRPESFPTPEADARDLYYRRQWHAAPPLPALPTPSPEPRGSAPLPDLVDPGHQVLARGAAARAADLLSQALRSRRNPLVDPVGRLTPEQDATRLEALRNTVKAAAPRS